MNKQKVATELSNYKFAINQHSIVAITDRLGCITYVNDKFCALSQYTEEELIGQDHRIINSGYHSKTFFQELYRTIHTGKVWHGEIKNKAKDGTFYWVSTTITPLKNDEGVIDRFIAVRTDITENKRIENKLITQNDHLFETQQELNATIEHLKQVNKEISDTNALLKKREEELEVSNTRFELAAAQANIGIWDRDLINDQSLWDDRLRQLYGLTDKKIDVNERKIWRNLIHPDDLGKVHRAFKMAMNGAHDFDIEYRIVWEDGSIRYLKPNAVVQRDSSGRAVRMIGTVMDVTEQKLAEITLRESEKKYKLLYEANLLPISIFDCETLNFLSVNNAFADKYGYSKKEFLAMTILDIRPDTEFEKVKESVKKDDIGVVSAGVFIHRKKNGEQIQVEIIRRDILFEGHNAKMVVINDVTERRLAEEALRKSEEKYRRDNVLLEESQAVAKLGGWELDLITETLYWTAEMYRIFDTSPDDFDPNLEKFVGYFISESKQILSEAMQAASTIGEGFDLFLETNTTKGRLIHVRTTCAVTMKDGKAINLTGICQDITEQKKIQDEIATSHTRLGLATGAANIGIWEYDLHNELLIWDDKMFKLFGVSKSNFSGTYEDWRSSLHPEDLQRSEQELQNAIQGLKGFDTNFRVIWPDQSIHDIRAFAEVIRDPKGKAIKVIGVNYDITDVVKREIELMKSKEKAEENDRLKSAFLANMRHEIRNPMNGIMGFSKQLANSDITPTQRKEFSSIVINSSNQLLSIIDDITAISLLETNQLHVNKSAVNINELLTELEMQFDIQAKTRNLKFQLIKSLPNEQSVISTDQSKLRRIITNLLTNAVKFTHKGSIEFGYEIKDQALLFFVKDSGIGLKADQLEKIFVSFQQADGAISRKYGGTGLGLTISKELAEIIGGKISVESTINEGSIFYLSLPFDQVNYLTKQSKVAINGKMKTTLLIAEDQIINFQYLKLLIGKKFNCNILHAHNGEEAIDIFKKNPAINLVLMDINMPVMDGFDAAKIIKELQPEVPIIAQTGYDIVTNDKYSPEIFNTYITKPVNENALLSKLSDYIAQNSKVSKSL